MVQFKLKDDLGGLRVGDDVRVGGYKVGTVNKIAPDDGAEPHLLVTVTLPARYTLHSDATVGVRTSLTGSACVNVVSLGSKGKLGADEMLVGTPDPKTVAFASLSNLAKLCGGGHCRHITHKVRTETLPKVNDAVDSTTRLVRHVDEKVDPIVVKYEQVTEKAGGALDSVHEMIGPSVNDFHGTMADLHVITGDLKGKLPDMLAKVDSTIDGTRAALDSVQKTVENTKEIAAASGAIAHIRQPGQDRRHRCRAQSHQRQPGCRHHRNPAQSLAPALPPQ